MKGNAMVVDQQEDAVLIEKRNGICNLVMNRPRIMNAVNFDLSSELLTAFQEIADDRETKVVILEGAGGHFTSGADMYVLNEGMSTTDWLWGMRKLSKMIITMREMPQPIICKVRGVAYGVGANLALAGDFVVASETMRFCEVFSNIGVILDGGGHYFLPRLVGPQKALELALLAEEVDGPAAAEMGLVYKCVPDRDLDNEVVQLASKLVNKPAQALALIKEGIVGSFDMTLKEVMAWEASHQTIMLQSEEHKAIVKDFLDSKGISPKKAG